jgi:hypothetical protein
MGDDRPSVYDEGDRVIYRASSVGNCIKSLVAARQGITPADHPDWLMEKFAEGNTAEPIIVDWIKQQGEWEFQSPHEQESYGGLPETVIPTAHDNQFLLEIPVGTQALLRCHLDGMAVCTGAKAGGKTSYGWYGLMTGKRAVVEVKAFGQSYWEKFEKEGIGAFPYYSNQVTIQMAGTGLPCMFVAALKEKGGDLARDSDGNLVTKVVFFRETPVPMGQIKARVLKVEAAYRRGELPDCDYNQYPCQYFFLHDDDDDKPEKKDKPVITLSGKDATKLNALCEEYLRGATLERSGKEFKDRAKREWKEFVGNYGGNLDAESDDPFVLETDLYLVEHTVRPMPEKVTKAHTQRYPTIKSKALEKEKMEAAAKARVE